MARINEPFDVLVVNQSQLLGAGKRPYELATGQLGIFDKKTGKHLYFVGTDVSKGTKQTNYRFSLNDVTFGVGLTQGVPLLSGATPNSKIDYVSYQEHRLAKELEITIKNNVKLKANTTYSFSVEVSDQSIYETIGYNRLRKYFSFNSGNIPDTDKAGEGFASKFVEHINANSGGFFRARHYVYDNEYVNIEIKFSSTYYNGILDAKVVLLDGFDSTTGLLRKEAVAAQGTGNIVRELEASSQGYRGNNYRLSTIWGTANEDIKLYAKEDKNYNLITIGYVNDIQNSGFRGKEPYTVILAIETGDVFNALKEHFAKAQELATLLV